MTGLAVQQLTNPRMGLAAHLEGVMNGILLLALGAAWPHVRLPRRAAALAFGAALFGAWANWATTAVAAALGTAAMTPLAAGGHRGRPWAELLVTVGFGSVGVAMLLAAALLLWGLTRRTTAGVTREAVIHRDPWPVAPSSSGRSPSVQSREGPRRSRRGLGKAHGTRRGRGKTDGT